MKHAVYAPIFNDYGDPRRLVDLAVTAEAAGYDGFFIWDHLAFEPDGQLEVVDATGAGDAFCGSLASRLASGDPLLAAVRWATAAGALATTRPGAVPAQPDARAVSELLVTQDHG